MVMIDSRLFCAHVFPIKRYKSSWILKLPPGGMIETLGINPTGQCGYFFDPHFDDQASMYMSGKYRTQLTDRTEIEEATVSVLKFKP